MKTQKNQGRSTRRTNRKSMSNEPIESHYIGYGYSEGTASLWYGRYAKTSMNSKYGC